MYYKFLVREHVKYIFQDALYSKIADPTIYNRPPQGFVPDWKKSELPVFSVW